MPRSVEITASSSETDGLADLVQRIDGVLSVRVYRGVSLEPAGDVIHLETTDLALHEVMKQLASRGVGSDGSTSITTSQPFSVVSASSRSAISRDTSEATWEEMELALARESNMTLLSLLVMAAAGAIAAIGITTNALHLVIGAMLIAPGFEPILRVSFGVVTRSDAWKRGLVDMVTGYGALFAGGAVATIALGALGADPLATEASYLPQGLLITYWTSVSGPSVLVSLIAAVAGALLVVTHRTVLTAGVMVALALVPSATIVAMAAVSLEADVAARAALRWAVDVAAVVGAGLIVLVWRRARAHNRDSML